MTEALPYWHRLIKAWLDRDRYGLTIPFVVGVGARISGAATADKASIEPLFREIIESPVLKFAVYPRWCDDVDSVVLATYANDFAYRPKHNLVEFHSTSGQLSMAAERSLAAKLGVKPMPSELLGALASFALPQVEAGMFSRYWTDDGRENGPFQAEDLVFIDEALARDAS